MGIHDNHRARMREKVFSGASRSFAPHEHLEILLYSSLPRTNTNEAAHALLQCGGDLNGVFKLSFDQLCNVKGIGSSTAGYLTKLTDLIEYALHPHADTCDILLVKEDVIDFATTYFDFDDENNAFAIFVNSMLNVINIWEAKMSIYVHQRFLSNLVAHALSCGAHGLMLLRKSDSKEHLYARHSRAGFERDLYEILNESNIKLHMYEEIREDGSITGRNGIIPHKPIIVAAQHILSGGKEKD